MGACHSLQLVRVPGQIGKQRFEPGVEDARGEDEVRIPVLPKEKLRRTGGLAAVKICNQIFNTQAGVQPMEGAVDLWQAEFPPMERATLDVEGQVGPFLPVQRY